MVFQTIISFDPFYGKSKKQAKLIAIYFKKMAPPVPMQLPSQFPHFFFCNDIAIEAGIHALLPTLELRMSNWLILAFNSLMTPFKNSVTNPKKHNLCTRGRMFCAKNLLLAEKISTSKKSFLKS